jgi:hypothetical protein
LRIVPDLARPARWRRSAFLACSFWLVGNYILQSRYADARKLFECLLSRCNDVGPLAEEIDTLSRMLGNFPQAYSDVGLINRALSLSRQRSPAEERANSRELPVTVAPVADAGTATTAPTSQALLVRRAASSHQNAST